MSLSSPDVLHAVLGVRIKLPPEALVPLLIGTGALLVLVFAGSALQSWKARNPGPASTFGLVVASLCAIGAIYFLVKAVPNQIDPNSEGTGQMSFFDAPIGGFLAALSCAFFRMGGKSKIALAFGLVVGIVLIAKPFILPVIVTYTESYGGRGRVSRSRGMLDPEHIEFVATGIVVLITGLIAGGKPLPPSPAYPPPPIPGR